MAYDFTVAFTPEATQGNISHILNKFGIPNTIIEVGCYEGSTTFWMAEAIGKLNPNLTIYGVDPHGNSVDILEDLEKAQWYLNKLIEKL